ncbi:hypothetical protein RJ639_034649 [Escallonia herrerae]|uniref:Retrotransposon Copia-like N-terminal domain-containing protein n=1 Tax=Escallonia herrerae TaxID=1293975 RepID=A0AA89BCS0_9ASTE|nr:hypothetical protein RJ639_034649 [Escallonia herrerae]
MDPAQLISIILDGSNYILWAQAMRSFIKGKKLWRYLTGDITIPVQTAGEPQLKFDERLDDWDSKNHQIITWFRNTSVPSVYQQFGLYNTAKEMWDLLAHRYTTADLAHQYQFHDSLHRMKQEPATSGNSSWYFDSGCCNRMASDHFSFVSKQHMSHYPLIHTADGSRMPVNHVGHVSTSTLSLPDTYFIPSLKLNLISVSQLCDLGFDLQFSCTGCRVQHLETDQTIGIGHKAQHRRIAVALRRFPASELPYFLAPAQPDTAWLEREADFRYDQIRGAYKRILFPLLTSTLLLAYQLATTTPATSSCDQRFWVFGSSIVIFQSSVFGALMPAAMLLLEYKRLVGIMRSLVDRNTNLRVARWEKVRFRDLKEELFGSSAAVMSFNGKHVNLFISNPHLRFSADDFWLFRLDAQQNIDTVDATHDTLLDTSHEAMSMPSFGLLMWHHVAPTSAPSFLRISD